jgi:magnesium transporter
MNAIAFNFNTKEEHEVSIEKLSDNPDDGIFYWVTIRPNEHAEARRALAFLHGNAIAVEELLGPQKEARYDLYDDAIHFSISEAWFVDGKLKCGMVECLRGPNFLVVVEPEESRVMDQIRRIYREDFKKFAKSSGFLIYELASVLLDQCRQTSQGVTNEVERIQLKLFGKVSDDIFLEVSRLTADILSFRRMVLAARDLFHELSSRKSAFISETTQPSLHLISERLERLGDDLDSERSVLNETLNLYMGMVSHRTNRIINRLTIFSMLFLPLSFLCGLYGMNFEVMPELGWSYSYAVFWAICIVFIISFIVVIKKKKWI